MSLTFIFFFERMYCGCSGKKVSFFFSLFIFFRKMLELIALFFDAELSAFCLIMIYSSQGLTAHIRKRLTLHQYYLRWPVALSERRVAVPRLLYGGREGTGAQPISKKTGEQLLYFFILTQLQKNEAQCFTQPSECYLTIVIRGECVSEC